MEIAGTETHGEEARQETEVTETALCDDDRLGEAMAYQMCWFWTEDDE